MLQDGVRRCGQRHQADRSVSDFQLFSEVVSISSCPVTSHFIVAFEIVLLKREA